MASENSKKSGFYRIPVIELLDCFTLSSMTILLFCKVISKHLLVTLLLVKGAEPSISLPSKQNLLHHLQH